MAAGNFLHRLAEPFTCNTPLKFDREKAVVSSRQNMNGNVGPALETAEFAEKNLGFLARLRRTGAQHIFRYVVQEVGREIKLRRLASAPRGFFPRFGSSCGVPPRASHFAGLWNHRIDEHEHPHGACRQTSGAVKPASD